MVRFEPNTSSILYSDLFFFETLVNCVWMFTGKMFYIKLSSDIYQQKM